jgi:hypothetical protein
MNNPTITIHDIRMTIGWKRCIRNAMTRTIQMEALLSTSTSFATYHRMQVDCPGHELMFINSKKKTNAIVLIGGKNFTEM